ncbi:MAG: hypothetical protein WC934_06030 [Acidithiobacillus sp.]|jgi:hypothetical protein|uniref:hypothetical protein n=1 Tax=Acidithiobacillus sp. TaxID=1872118 RepID=UPI00355D94C5
MRKENFENKRVSPMCDIKYQYKMDEWKIYLFLFSLILFLFGILFDNDLFMIGFIIVLIFSLLVELMQLKVRKHCRIK